jgi:hypothetical protein
MKTLLLLLFISLSLNAATSCIKCHPAIVSEFETSMHKKSSIYEDEIHKAVWDKHPAKKKDNYKCAKCHTPNAKSKDEAHKGITCITCHTIKDVNIGSKSNKNIYETKDKTFYSAEAGREDERVVYKTMTTWWGNKTTVGSAYHDIDYTNKQFYNGQMCMGCHSHKQNSKKFLVCSTQKPDLENKKENCITCHMPKVLGSATTVRISKTHRFHGFAGARVKPKMLSKYVTLNLEKQNKGFNLTIQNNAPHNLLTHPLRKVQLRVAIVRGSLKSNLKTHTFEKIIGHEGKPSMPWLATEVVKDTMIKANEKRVIEFNEMLELGDRVEVTLGYYLVNPKALKKLNLDTHEELKKFTILKTKGFTIN